MSVCACALAENSKAIVCVADKALSYGSLQWDSDTSKIIAFDPATVVMFADEGNGPRVLSRFELTADRFKVLSREGLAKFCEEQYRTAVDELVEATYLRPRLLTKAQYITAITATQVNHLLRGVADEIRDFQMKVDLIIAGFYGGSAQLLSFGSLGVATDLTGPGFHAIGSGWEKAVSRLLFSQHERKHGIERTLFDLFDAKANSEMQFGVGTDWDAKVLVSGKKPIEVPKRIKDIIEKVWVCRENEPFETPDDDQIPPATWKSILRKLAAECLAMPSDPQTSEGPQ